MTSCVESMCFTYLKEFRNGVFPGEIYNKINQAGELVPDCGFPAIRMFENIRTNRNNKERITDCAFNLCGYSRDDHREHAGSF